VKLFLKPINSEMIMPKQIKGKFEARNPKIETPVKRKKIKVSQGRQIEIRKGKGIRVNFYSSAR